MPGTRAITEGLFLIEGDGPRLLAGRCAACGKLHFPATAVCPYCGADGALETRVGPAARLCLYTAVLSRPPGYRGEVPYGFGVAELEGGLRVIARLTEPDPAQLAFGQAMRLVADTLPGDIVTWAFSPAPS